MEKTDLVDNRTLNEYPDSSATAPDKDRTALSDILEAEKIGGVFNKYIDKSEIAKKIAAQFFRRKYNNKGRKGFFNSDLDRSQVGLITQCYGLQVIYSLNKMNLEATEYADKIYYVIDDIFNQMQVTKQKIQKIEEMGNAINLSQDLFNFNMTPFINIDDPADDADDIVSINSCVESAANVIRALAEIRDVLISQADSSKGLLKEVSADVRSKFVFFSDPEITDEDTIIYIEKIIKYALAWLISACIPVQKGKVIKYAINGVEAKNPYINYLGWNFFKSDSTEVYEPSLYVTFSVCSAYMSLTETIGSNTIEDVIKKDYKKFQSSAYDRNYRFASYIIDEIDQFKKQCMDAGRYEEMRCNGTLDGRAPIDLTNSFIGQNYTSVSFKDIENSTTNDALINTIFHVLILIYAGIDLDYSEISTVDEFYDEMQYALQNALRSYKYLLRMDKGYIVDQYVLSFKEKMPLELVPISKALRRQRIQVASTLPLMIRAYNEVSKYLIKYPQKQNIEYLTLIMTNRTETKNGREWSWDRDGYNITSENYYVKALNDFYEYYEEYESRYIDPDITLQKEITQLKSENDEYILKREKFWEQEKKKLCDELSEKEKQLAEKRDPLVEEVTKIAREVLKNNLAAEITDLANALLENSDNALNKLLSQLIFNLFFGEPLASIRESKNKLSSSGFMKGDVRDDATFRGIISFIRGLRTGEKRETLRDCLSTDRGTEGV